VQTVLLDAGGVLLDLDYRFLVRLLEAQGCDVTVCDMSRAESVARAKVQQRLSSGARPDELWEDYFQFMLANVGAPLEAHDSIIKTLWEAHHRVGLWTAAIPGAVETVRQLNDLGFRLGVVSNAEGQVERDLKRAGFEGLFETIVDSTVVGVAKPDPEIFRIALDRMGAKAESSVFLGDVPAVDIEGARAAGITALLLDRHDMFPDIDAPRIRSIAELPVLLAGLTGSEPLQ
jgi:putative hydrolase of the HAD superfamily